MQVLTAGGYLEIKRRGSFLDGIGSFSSPNSIELIPRPSGEFLTRTYEAIYRKNPWCYGCVNIISRGLVGMPLKIYELLPDGERQRVRGDLPSSGRIPDPQRLDNLLRKPAPLVSRNRQFRRTFKDVLIRGNALWEKVRDPQTGKLVRLVYHPWRKTRPIVPEIDAPLIGYAVRELGFKERILIPSDVVHFRAGDDETGDLGVSPLEPIAMSLAIQDAVSRHLKAWFGNNARMGGNLKMTGGMNTALRKEIQEEINQFYGGPENSGRILVTNGEYQPIGETPEHSSVLDVSKVTREEIFAVYSVPPPLVGVLDRAIMSNVRELRSFFVRDLVGPWAGFFEDEIRVQLIDDSSEPNWRSLFAEFDLAERLRPDIEARAKAYRDLRSVYKTNEFRAFDNLPPIDNPLADAVWMPGGEQPIVDGQKGLPAPPEPPSDDEEDEEDEDL